MKVSVALCTYNGAQYLQEQLESLNQQTRVPDELVVRDDCSTDETMAVLERFAEEANFPVRIIQNKAQLGITRNFEEAIFDCQGDLIFICDQDDYWYPSKIADYCDRFAAKPTLSMVCSDSLLWSGAEKVSGRSVWQNERFSFRRFQSSKNKFLATLNHSPFSGHAIAFKRPCRDVIRPIPEHWYYDQWIAKVCAALGEIELIDTPLTAYRQHQTQTMGSPQHSIVDLALQRENGVQNYFSHEQAKFTLLLERLTKSTLQTKDVREESGLRKDIAQLEAKIVFLKKRADLRQRGWSRVWPILWHTLNGNYFKYARGVLTIGRDTLG